jgi:hypothetical protein
MSSFSLQSQSRELKKTPHIKRYLLIYILILIFLMGILGTFWGAGKVFKYNYLAFIKTLSIDENIPIKVIEYNQGWFHSSAKIFIQTDFSKYAMLFNSSFPKNSSKINSGFMIEQEITHGPFVHDDNQNKYTFAIALIKSNVFITLPTNLSNEDKKEIIKFHSLALMGNQYNSHFETSSANLMIYETSVKWQGISGNIHFSLLKDHINTIIIELNNGPLVIKYLDYLLNISGITIKSDMTINPTGLWNGTQLISIPQVSLMASNNKYIINNFNSTSKFNVNQQNIYDYTSQTTIGELNIPEFVINPMQITYSITGVNAKGLNDFIILSKNINKDKTIDQEKNQIFEKYFSNIFTPNIQTTLDMINMTNFGKMTVHAKADWPENIALPNNLEAIKKNVRVRIDLSLPVALVDHILISYFNKIQPPITEQSVPTQPRVESLESFKNEIEQLQDDDKISISTKTRLISILEQHPDFESFSLYLDQLVTMNSIAEEMAGKLKDEYKIVQKIESDRLANPDKYSSASLPVEATTPNEMAKERIDAYKNLGYIIQQDDNYITVITFENGQFKTNDKLLPQ